VSARRQGRGEKREAGEDRYPMTELLRWLAEWKKQRSGGVASGRDTAAIAMVEASGARVSRAGGGCGLGES
jgi:hypothetical protein